MRNKLPSHPLERQDPCKPRRRAAFFIACVPVPAAGQRVMMHVSKKRGE
ncbi:hypothetical protein P355_4550 [Burkholderia cenocepacia KC-01]|nr:hypothetical protein P355_4550 [Burkholderia cenocepacia KC-01]